MTADLESRFDAAAAAFAAMHAEDPRRVETTEGSLPASLRYHATVLHWVDTLQPAASEVVRLAALGQHVRRWTIPRTDYPEGKTGYKQWRSTLARMHADTVQAVLTEIGYDEATVERVGDILIKKRLRSDPQAQLLEDAVCLTFLQLEYLEFAERHPAGKVVEIVRKTWGKMSEQGHAAALGLVAHMRDTMQEQGVSTSALALVERAVSG